MLSILFGLGWGIGLMATEKVNSNFIQYMFSTLFIIVTSFHGLLIFILHCARSKEAREEWAKWFFKATKRDFSDLTASVLDHFYHHRKTSSSQVPFQTSTSKATKMFGFPPSMASPSSLTTTDSGGLKLVPVKQCQLAKVLDEETTKEDACEKAMEAEMETELAKVDLAEMEAQHASSSTLNSATNSLDQNTSAFQEDSVAVIVHVPEDATLQPKASVLDIQGSPVTTAGTMNRESSHPTTIHPKQALEDAETQKVQDLQLAFLDNAEKNARKDVEKPKELNTEAGKLHSEEVKCDEVKINGVTGDEVADSSMILEAVMAGQD